MLGCQVKLGLSWVSVHCFTQFSGTPWPVPWPGYLEDTKALEGPQMVWQVARCFWEPPWAALAPASPPAAASEGLPAWGSAQSTSLFSRTLAL